MSSRCHLHSVALSLFWSQTILVKHVLLVIPKSSSWLFQHTFSKAHKEKLTLFHYINSRNYNELLGWWGVSVNQVCRRQVPENIGEKFPKWMHCKQRESFEGIPLIARSLTSMTKKLFSFSLFLVLSLALTFSLALSLSHILFLSSPPSLALCRSSSIYRAVLFTLYLLFLPSSDSA